MKKYHEIILSFVNSKNEQESLRYENKLLISSAIPILIFISALNMALYVVFPQSGILNSLINSVSYLVLAGMLYLISRLFRSERMVSNLIVVFLILLVVFIVWRYYITIGPAVWTIIFIIMIFAMISNNRFTLSALSVSLFVIGIYLWSKDYPYDMENVYYASQFIAFAILFIISAVVQSANIERYKKIKHYLGESEMISKISADFITVNSENLDEKVNAMLEQSGKYLGVDRAVIFLLTKNQKNMIYAYEWCTDGQQPKSSMYESYDVESRAEWVDQIQNKTVWIIPNVDALDEKEAPGKKNLQELNVKAMISMPIEVGGTVYGTLICQSHTRNLNWKGEHTKILGVLTNFLSDIFLKVESEEKINTMAYNDMLTGLPNRGYFNMKLEQAIAEASEKHTQVAVVFIDLDAFKSINDSMGHEGGDAILKIVGQRLGSRLPPGGIAARFGGDEFILMIPQVKDLDFLRLTMADIMAAFLEPIAIKGMNLFIMASAGVAVYPDDSEDPHQLIRHADHAMYSAKQKGKNQAIFCTNGLKEDINRKMQLTYQMYRPEFKNELVLDYQPLVDLETKTIVGVESLLRWHHPELGIIQPNELIPLAEQTGLINSIGLWVLREACRQNKAWQDAGFRTVRMSVNVSAKQFLSTDLLEAIKQTLAETGLEPKYLELEITESTAVNQTGYIPGMLEQIKALGVTLSIDDFGTEYSSLSRITQLPIDRIKMDMQFVSGIAVSEKDETVAKIIISLANSLGLKVVAEGVETKVQLDFLKQRICDEVQGFYLYRPMPAREVEKIMTQSIEI